ncbi:MAG: hypothetical protein IH987_22015 [Planctomycetes bacterium]|nr:hypothetical protein [Planctomycetota bacterium]
MNEPAIEASHRRIMSGLFGFVDWQGDLPPDTGERMASYMTDGADRATAAPCPSGTEGQRPARRSQNALGGWSVRWSR